MSDFVVSVSDLRSKASTLRDLNERFKAQVSELEATQANLNGMWEGEAREQFAVAFQNDRTQMTNFYNAVLAYVVRLEEMAVRYEQAEAANVEIAMERKYK